MHSNDIDFEVTCGINECSKVYKKCSSFVSHVYRCHREFIVQNTPVTNPSCSSLAINQSIAPVDVLNELDATNDCGLLDIQHTVHQLLGVEKQEQKKKSALFILYLKKIKCLSEAAVQVVISKCQEMIDYSTKRIEAGVNERLCAHGIDPQELALSEVFTDVSNPFEGLNNIYLQEKYFSEQLGCIVSGWICSLSTSCIIFYD